MLSLFLSLLKGQQRSGCQPTLPPYSDSPFSYLLAPTPIPPSGLPLPITYLNLECLGVGCPSENYNYWAFWTVSLCTGILKRNVKVGDNVWVVPSISYDVSLKNYLIYFLKQDRVIFNWVSKVIRDCIGFALLCSVIGLENSRHLLNQSDTKLKPIATWLLAFSRA